MRALARHDQVVCKVSGLVTELDLSGSDAPLRAVWDVLLDAFGPSRLAWGSDWPVCLLAGAYERWAGLTADLLAPLSPDEQDAVLCGTASTAYGLEVAADHPVGHPARRTTSLEDM